MPSFLKSFFYALRIGVFNAHLLRGRFDRAAATLQRLCYEDGALNEIGPDELERGGANFVDLGLCYMELGRYAEAVRVFAHAFERRRSFCRSFQPQSTVRESYLAFLNAFAGALDQVGEVERAREIRGEAVDYIRSADTSA
jgi:tetratricopeptide (TPR) repeat protein